MARFSLREFWERKRASSRASRRHEAVVKEEEYFPSGFNEERFSTEWEAEQDSSQSLSKGKETNESCHLILTNGIKRLLPSLRVCVHFHFILKYFSLWLLSFLMRRQHTREWTQKDRLFLKKKCFRGNWTLRLLLFWSHLFPCLFPVVLPCTSKLRSIPCVCRQRQHSHHRQGCLKQSESNEGEIRWSLG